jgi:hypothetical protein
MGSGPTGALAQTIASGRYGRVHLALDSASTVFNLNSGGCNSAQTIDQTATFSNAFDNTSYQTTLGKFVGLT